MEKLDRNLLKQVKAAFVAMPGGADPSLGAGPVAGGGMLTQAQASPMGGTPPMDPAMMGGDPAAMGGAPMDPAMMGGDPAAMGGAPMDPAAMGGMPMDPAAMGGMPMDPAMMGGDPAAMGGDPAEAGPSMISMTVQEFTEILTTLLTAAVEGKAVSAGGGGSGASPKQGGGKAGTEAKLDQILTMLGGGSPAPAA